MPSENFPTFSKAWSFVLSTASASKRRIKRMRPGSKVVLAFATAALLVMALRCISIWIPCGNPAGMYDAPFFRCLCSDSKAVLVVTPNHSWYAICYHSTPKNREIELDFGTWDRNPETGFLEFRFNGELGSTPYTAVFYGRSYWGRMKWYLVGNTQEIQEGMDCNTISFPRLWSTFL